MGKYEDALRSLESGGTVVDVSETKLTESQVKKLGDAIGKSGKVTKLWAEMCGITDSGATALAAGIEKCPLLQELNLSQNQISDSGATALAAGIEKCPQLQGLDLRNNQISDSGATALAAAVPKCPKLTILGVSGNASISKKASQAIAKALKGPRVPETSPSALLEHAEAIYLDLSARAARVGSHTAAPSHASARTTVRDGASFDETKCVAKPRRGKWRLAWTSN